MRGDMRPASMAHVSRLIAWMGNAHGGAATLRGAASNPPRRPDQTGWQRFHSAASGDRNSISPSEPGQMYPGRSGGQQTSR